ncbi:MAG: hypothetical protein NVSMB8_04850 [Candidatus Limnocylindrales bacterium]
MLGGVRLVLAIVAASVTAVGAAPRILLAAGILPDALRPFVWTDVLLVYVRGLSGHRLPYLDSPFEYPPLTALVSGVASLASDGPVPFVAIWGALQVMLAGSIAWTLAGAAGTGATLKRFVLAPQLVLLGTANFDLLAIAFLSNAVVSARGRRETRAAAYLGLGTLSKLFPIAAAPVLLARASRPARVALVGTAIIGIGYGAAALAGPSGANAPLYYLIGIDANLDSPWGLLRRVLSEAGVAEAHAIVTAVTLIGLAATYLIVIPRIARGADPAVPFGLALVVTLIWTRLYSPQYSLWLLPFFVLLPLRGRLFALLTVSDVLVFATVYPLTLVRREPGDATATALLAVLVAGVLLRLVALTGTGWALLRIARQAGGARAASRTGTQR